MLAAMAALVVGRQVNLPHGCGRVRLCRSLTMTMITRRVAESTTTAVAGGSVLNQDKVKRLLAELRAELSSTDTLDDDTRELAEKVDRNIDDLIEASQPNSPELDDAIALEARFAATHPVAERIMRELIATLSRIGI